MKKNKHFYQINFDTLLTFYVSNYVTQFTSQRNANIFSV